MVSISKARSIYLSPEEVIANVPLSNQRLSLRGIVPYSEVSLMENPLPHFGSLGDIWINTTPKHCSLFAKLHTGWTQWRGLDDDPAVVLAHPTIRGRFLWIWFGWIGWVPRQYMAKPIVPYPSPDETVTRMLAKALADTNIDLRSNITRAPNINTSVGGPNIQLSYR